MAAQPIPERFNSLSAYLIVKDPKQAIEFYAKAFGAENTVTMMMPDGQSVMHAEMVIGNSTFMLTAENPQWGARSAETIGGSPISMHVYVENCDALFERAVGAGCEVSAPMTDMFWGDRFGKVKDPFGIEWGIATHKEDLNEEEMGKRAAEFFASMAPGGDCSG
ncbi:MAG: VOC family protein [bacterium]|nr:VOC family protein [bacterium]